MLSAKVSDVELHQSVSMTGRMETSHYWLVEGRVLEGRLGYDVVMPFESEFGWVLLDRGWIEEAQLHELTFPNGISTVLAIREEPTDLPLIDENNNTLVNWPHRIVEVDAQVLARQLGLNTALPYFRLLPESAHVLTYRERKLRVSPARHQGYAVQWLLMGLALCVAWFFCELESIHTDKEEKMKRSQKALFAMIVVSILPVAAAYVMYFSGIGVPDSTVNKGTLLSAPQPLGPLVSDAMRMNLESDKKWRIVIPVEGECDTECEQALYLTRQVHIRLAHRSERVERIALWGGGLPNSAQLTALEETHPRLINEAVDEARLTQWLNAFNLPSSEAAGYYLVDQEGRAMMHYTLDIDGNDLLKDLKRALKFSIDYQQ